MNYEPVIHINDYWSLLRDFQPINETVQEVGFHVTYQVQIRCCMIYIRSLSNAFFQPISLFKLQMYASQAMQNQWTSMLGDSYGDDSEQDKDSLKVIHFVVYRTVCLLPNLFVAFTLIQPSQLMCKLHILLDTMC